MMSIRSLSKIKKGIAVYLQKFLVFYSKYKFLLCSELPPLGDPIIRQPSLFMGKGTIKFGRNTSIGIKYSKEFLSSYSYFEARSKYAKILIGNNVVFNNSCSIICDRSEISIGDDCLFGPNCDIFDSDFHDLSPSKRKSTEYNVKKVRIGKNVFLGANVKVLKGVEIGDNSVVGANSVVTCSLPSNSIAAGNPAKVIKKFD